MRVRDRNKDTANRTPDVSSEITETERPDGSIIYRTQVILCNRDDEHDARYTLSVHEAEYLAESLLNVCRVIRDMHEDKRR